MMRGYEMQQMTIPEMVAHAARAKARGKATARGWSMLSQQEIISLIFIADCFLEDGELPDPAPAKPEPPVISHL